MARHLMGKLNIGLLEEKAKKEFFNFLDDCEGSKTLIWDERLSGPLGLIAEYTSIQKRNVLKMTVLGHGRFEHIPDTDNIIFITRPMLKHTKFIAEKICDERFLKNKKKFHVFFVPYKSLICEHYLENKGVYASVNVGEIPGCVIFPFDNDLMSMEYDLAFREYVDGDESCLHRVAKALITIEDLFGPIGRFCGKGDAAAKIMELLKKLRKEPATNASRRSNHRHSNNRNPSSKCEIDAVVLLDRSADLLSILPTQLTYEGLVDEFYGVNSCTVKLPSGRFPRNENELTDGKEKDKLLVLNSADKVYVEIRDLNYAATGKVLSRQAKEMAAMFEERHGKTVQEMKQFVTKLPELLSAKKSLSNQMTLAEMIKEKTDRKEFAEQLRAEEEILCGRYGDKYHPFIDHCMARKENIVKVLRLICMQSLAGSGLKPKLLEQYKQDIIQTYGFQHLLTLKNLEKAGLLKAQVNGADYELYRYIYRPDLRGLTRLEQGARNFAVLRKMMKLTVEETNVVAPKDVHFVHNIYAPLSVRIVQEFAKGNGLKSLSDVSGLLPGDLFDKVISTDKRSGSISQTDSPNIILVFFIGGCTFAEINALRFLSQQDDTNAEFVIATTSIVNGNSFVKNLMEPLE